MQIFSLNIVRFAVKCDLNSDFSQNFQCVTAGIVSDRVYGDFSISEPPDNTGSQHLIIHIGKFPVFKVVLRHLIPFTHAVVIKPRNWEKRSLQIDFFHIKWLDRNIKPARLREDEHELAVVLRRRSDISIDEQLVRKYVEELPFIRHNGGRIHRTELILSHKSLRIR